MQGAQEKAGEGLSQAQSRARETVADKVPQPDEADSQIRGASDKHVKPAAKSVADKAQPTADRVADEKVGTMLLQFCWQWAVEAQVSWWTTRGLSSTGLLASACVLVRATDLIAVTCML